MQLAEDIFTIDRKVKRHINKRASVNLATINEIKALEKRIYALSNPESCTVSKRDVRSSNKSSNKRKVEKSHKISEESRILISTLEYEIAALKEGMTPDGEILFYEQEVSSILDEYDELLKIREPVSFFASKSTSSKENSRRRAELSSQYIEVVSKYTDENFKITTIKNETDTLKDIVCEGCGSVEFDDSNDHMLICLICGIQQDVVSFSTTFKDTQRLNTTTVYEYDRKTHFKEVLDQYQGKQNTQVDQCIYDTINNFLDLYDLINHDCTRRIDKYSRVTRAHIKSCLKDMKVKKHYDDYIYIHSTLTGQKTPDISRWEGVIQEDHTKMLEVYNTLPDSVVGSRKNFLNSKYVLQQLHLRHNIPFEKDDFVFLKSMDRMITHNRVCEAIFKVLGWKFSKII